VTHPVLADSMRSPHFSNLSLNAAAGIVEM